jgi:hypothetical protein
MLFNRPASVSNLYADCYVSYKDKNGDMTGSPGPSNSAMGGYNQDEKAPVNILPVADGGTGSDNAAGARSNLGAAPIVSPDFRGTPTAPTPSSSADNTQIATTAFVQAIAGNAASKTEPEFQGPIVIKQGIYIVKIYGYMIEFWIEGTLMSRILMKAIGTVMSLVASGLPLACEGLNSDGGISQNGVNPAGAWTKVSDTTFSGSYIYAIAYGDEKFVAVGSYGKARISTDGFTWTAVNDTMFSGSYIYAIAFGDGKFVARGDAGKMAYSLEGVSWTAVSNTTFGNTEIYVIAYGGGKFVAGSNDGKMTYSSDDGVTWTAVSDTTFSGSDIYAIAYGDGKFVAAGNDGKTAYSKNGGITWTKLPITDPLVNLREIIYAEGTFMIIGNSTESFFSSSNDIIWQNKDIEIGSGILYGVGYSPLHKRFVCYGENGKMFYVNKENMTLVFGPNGSVSWKKAG